MKSILKAMVLLLLCSTVAIGFMTISAEPVSAVHTCPYFTCPKSLTGWSSYGSCQNFDDPHCPVECGLYRHNEYTSWTCYTGCSDRI